MTAAHVPAATDVRVTEEWLALREPADAEARSTQLVRRLQQMHVASAEHVIHDLGCGSGSMGRWLAPMLDGPQHWVLHDRDADLLDRAAGDPPGAAADGRPVSVRTRQGDLSGLTPDDLAPATLVTASALLDMMTADEVEHLVHLCVAAGCPALLTLSVTGRVELTPSDALDARLGAAFDDHQRRTVGGRALLGPDAVRVAVQRFRDLGAEVVTRPSPWRLDPRRPGLTAQWLAGWVGAACEQRPELTAAAAEYHARRAEQLADGRLGVMVHHLDLLAVPAAGASR